MNGNKYVILVLAVAGIILWNTPNTVSLFADSHTFYNGSAPCSKCHGDILAQLQNTGSVNAMHLRLDAEGGCRSCHSNPINIEGRNVTEEYHSAYLPYCLECHQNSSSINNYKEAHTLIVSAANNSSQNLGLNEACAMCHTTIMSEVTVRNRVVFPFENDSVAVNGSAEYNGFYTTTFSNPPPTGLHDFYSGVQCIMCHAPVQDILNQPETPYPVHNSFGCEGCHRGSGMTPGQTNETRTDYHAAKIKYCSDCHGQVSYPRDCNQCHYSHGGLKAGSAPANTTASASTDGAALYTQYCSSCHGPLANSTKLGANATLIQNAINSNLGGMSQFSFLNATQVDAIAAALNGTAQAPSSTDGAALYTQYCSSCHGPLANSTKLGANATLIQNAINSNLGGMGQFSFLNATQVQLISTALGG